MQGFRVELFNIISCIIKKKVVPLRFVRESIKTYIYYETYCN